MTRADTAVQHALELVAVVRDLDRDGIARQLATRDRAQIEALTVALAAMVPIDLPPSELLAWCDPDRRLDADRNLKPHGTHAAWMRHKNNGTPPCALCVAAERTYHRERKRRIRAADTAEQTGRKSA